MTGYMVIGASPTLALLYLWKLCVCLRLYTVNAFLNISMKTEHPQPAQVVLCMHLCMRYAAMPSPLLRW